MSLGGLNGGKVRATGLDKRGVIYNVPRQNQTSAIMAGRMAIKQCRSSVTCEEEVWRCCEWSAWAWSKGWVCTRHATAATAMRHTISMGKIFQVFAAGAANMSASLPL